MKTKTSPDPDGIGTLTLKNTLAYTATSIATLTNRILETGVFPKIFKKNANNTDLQKWQ